MKPSIGEKARLRRMIALQAIGAVRNEQSSKSGFLSKSLEMPRTSSQRITERFPSVEQVLSSIDLRIAA